MKKPQAPSSETVPIDPTDEIWSSLRKIPTSELIKATMPTDSASTDPMQPGIDALEAWVQNRTKQVGSTS